MVTCFLKYQLNPDKISEFSEYAKLWIKIIPKFGGTHHGYFLPHEGANNIGYALFSFSSLAEYEQYRIKSQSDSDCIAAYNLEKTNKSIISYERTFMNPLLG